MARIMYPIAFKLQALGLLETMNDYEVAAELGVARRTIRNWQSKRSELLAYKGNKKPMKLKPGARPEVFPDPPGMLEFIHGLRDAERALTTIHMVTWIKRNQRAWLVSYLANKKPGTGYNSLLLLLRRFSARHGLSRQRPGTSKRSQEDLEDTRDIFAAEFHREYRAHGSESVYNVDETGIYIDMPPNYIWAVRGGSSKISSGEKHSMRMTAVLTAKADGTKLPILFIMKGVPGGRIEANEFSTFPAGHSYAVQEKAWMDGRVWKTYLRTVLHDDIEEASVILVDNFESHVSEASYKIINEELGSHLCPLPPNSTSMCQPLDVGVMAPFKRHLRELWLYEDIITGDDDDPFSLTARQKRLALIKRAIAAWDMVSTETIRGSFEKALPQEPMDCQ
ncbi:hypothetical protein DYB28_010349 [Aphanomyces astaci]|uniref:DDE-1 domain-containing protein n=1 Tax=Aphanomyces astaci TaxID=112090 RepID=A0A9X8HEE8_APHAT|nr:hypothetical protein DYB28_010349 [Aphanomyces astaci]